MRFEDKLKKQRREELWNEYCGFLDLDIDQYMQIQKRLLQEQIELWGASELGRRILDGKKIRSAADFRKNMPLTTYADYADILLQKRGDLLPDEPVMWIQTTWEGGKHPIKLAPYTSGMLEIFRNNVVASLILCTSQKRGQFTVKPGDKTLYGFAPLPYVTGLFPVMFGEEITLKYLPSLKDMEKMSFGERNKAGFAMGLNRGIDLFFGLSSVVSYITEGFSEKSTKGSGKGKFSVRASKMSPGMIARYLKASYRSKRDGVPVKPRDLFKLKGLVCAGTDTNSYKDYLEESWGIRPMEIAAGTEPTIIGTETWDRNGLVFFPDAGFFEFIPENEAAKNMDDPLYRPKTVLMNELKPNRNYELVITNFKGGAFARYRVGDLYQCTGLYSEKDGVRLPHLRFVDRTSSVIDIAGFTRITENSIEDVIALSGLRIRDWVAAKEYSHDQRPFLHMYVEMEKDVMDISAVSADILTSHLSVYFKYFDNDYNDLKRLLGIDPLVVTILRSGTMNAYRRAGHAIRRLNPSSIQIAELMEMQNRLLEGPYFIIKGGTASND